ncbi:unnamed protein product [Pleuronectes platessa]|uniref:IgGFc-binding protein N-terminal domain-containing protein n=1 Tax=Pleuronectes platessa TaxID=8262 RepID=A0A9N7TPL0_PLEPL|nr:unnamed protein product [Pleuronectes platessa]
MSTKPVTVLASFCTHTGCDHSSLHDVSSWGTRYYPVTPHFPNQTAVSQMMITSADHDTPVNMLLSGDTCFNGNMYPTGIVLKLNMGALQSVYIESSASLSGSELNSKGAINIARALLNSATVSSIHTVERSIQGFKISIVKGDRNMALYQ